MLPYCCTVDNHALHRHACLAGNRLDDPQVRLVRNHQIDVGASDPRPPHDPFARLAHPPDRAFEDGLAVEVPDGVAKGDVEARIAAADSAHAKHLARVRVAPEYRADDAQFLIAGLDHDGRRSISKQHGDVAIVPVQVSRNQLDAYDYRGSDRAVLNQRGGRGQAVDETGAGRIHIHGGRTRRAEHHLDS
jgi:hypothetical protein